MEVEERVRCKGTVHNLQWLELSFNGEKVHVHCMGMERIQNQLALLNWFVQSHQMVEEEHAGYKDMVRILPRVGLI